MGLKQKLEWYKKEKTTGVEYRTSNEKLWESQEKLGLYRNNRKEKRRGCLKKRSFFPAGSVPRKKKTSSKRNLYTGKKKQSRYFGKKSERSTKNQKKRGAKTLLAGKQGITKSSPQHGINR